MKKINFYIMAFLAVLTIGCTDDDKLAIDVEDLETGAFLRTVNIVSGGFDFLNLGTSEFSVVVEADDTQNGALLESVDLFVTYDDRTPEDGGSDVAEALVKTIPASAFTAGPNGLPQGTVSATTQETLAAVGLTEADLAPGDVFVFRLASNLTTGQTFSSTNSGSNITGSFFNSPFRYSASVGCPIEDARFVGDYTVNSVGAGPFGSFAAESFTVSISAVTKTQRKFNFSYLPDIGGFGQSFELEFICTKAVVLRHATGIGCGGGSITWAAGGESTEFDILDDSSFTLNLMDFVEDGGCGVQAYPVSLTFTKN